MFDRLKRDITMKIEWFSVILALAVPMVMGNVADLLKEIVSLTLV